MWKQGHPRHLAAPRTLLLLEREGRLLLVRGAPHKWWAGRWNGLGGGVQPGEDILSAARREAREETGLEPENLELAAVVHVRADPAVLLFVFQGTLPAGDLAATPEGTLCWIAKEELEGSDLPLMPDLRPLIARLRQRPAGAAPLHLVVDHREGPSIGGSDA
jgi:8-oxo-dGTP diphosphatase